MDDNHTDIIYEIFKLLYLSFFKLKNQIFETELHVHRYMLFLQLCLEE